VIRRLRRFADRLRHPERYRRLEQLLRALRWSRAELLAQRQDRFEDLVRFAATHSDYYAERLAGLIDGKHGPIDPAGLPLLSKADLNAHRDAILVRGPARSRARLGHTGGSTGEPTGFYYDEAKHELMLAGMMRGFMLSGWRPGERVLYLWGAPRDLAGGGVFARAAGGWLGVERAIPALEFDAQRLGEWLAVLRRWRPRLVYGYASALDWLAGQLLDRGIDPGLDLHGVYSTAEVLDPAQRERIGRAFGCQVFNQYGCREVPNIAWECRAGSMHVFADMVLLESVPGASGHRLLATSLTDRLMPFIRYDTGDSGEILDDACPCGLPFPLLRMDVCRQNDMVRLPGGRLIHPAWFNRQLYGIPGITRYQWRQAGPTSLELDLVAAEPLADHVVAGLRASLARELDPSIGLVVNYRTDIPRTAAGKHRFVIGWNPSPPT
jgi:phenylacetate-CoA ligase